MPSDNHPNQSIDLFTVSNVRGINGEQRCEPVEVSNLPFEEAVGLPAIGRHQGSSLDDPLCMNAETSNDSLIQPTAYGSGAEDEDENIALKGSQTSLSNGLHGTAGDGLNTTTADGLNGAVGDGLNASRAHRKIAPALRKSGLVKPNSNPTSSGPKRKRGRPPKSLSVNKPKADQGMPPDWVSLAQYLMVSDVAALFRVSKATVWRWVSTIPDFPRPRKLSNGATRWRLAEIIAFKNSPEDNQ